jgi:hypothetical protein
MGNNQTLITHLLKGTCELPPPSTMILNARWNLTPLQIQDEIKRKGKSSNNFAEWLKAHFEIATLANGTVVASRRESVRDKITPESLQEVLDVDPE